MSPHRTYTVHLDTGWRAKCSDCSWEDTVEPTYELAAAGGREHERVRREKQTVHPWLDVK